MWAVHFDERGRPHVLTGVGSSAGRRGQRGVPGGQLLPRESPAAAALRGLRAEAGFVADPSVLVPLPRLSESVVTGGRSRHVAYFAVRARDLRPAPAAAAVSPLTSVVFTPVRELQWRLPGRDVAHMLRRAVQFLAPLSSFREVCSTVQRCLPPPPPSTRWRLIAERRGLRRSPSVAAAHRTHVASSQSPQRVALSLMQQFAKAPSWASHGFILRRHPFPYDVRPAADHYVLLAHPDFGRDALGHAPSWLGARRMLAALGVADGQHLSLHVERWLPATATFPEAFPQAHVFVRGGSAAAAACCVLTTGGFALHQRVQSRLGAWTGWYAGAVTAVHQDGTYCIAFDDGEVHDRCPPSRMRRVRSTGEAPGAGTSRGSPDAHVDGASVLRPLCVGSDDFRGGGQHQWHDPIGRKFWRFQRRKLALRRAKFRAGRAARPVAARKAFPPGLDWGQRWDRPTAATPAAEWDHMYAAFTAAGGVPDQGSVALGSPLPRTRRGVRPRPRVGTDPDVALADVASAVAPGAWADRRTQPAHVHAADRDCPACRWAHRASSHAAAHCVLAGTLRLHRADRRAALPAVRFSTRSGVAVHGMGGPAQHVAAVRRVWYPASAAQAAANAARSAKWAARRAKSSRQQVVHVATSARAYRRRAGCGARPASAAAHVAFDALVSALQAISAADLAMQSARSWAFTAAAARAWTANGGPAPLPLARTLACRHAADAARVAQLADAAAHSACTATSAAILAGPPRALGRPATAQRVDPDAWLTVSTRRAAAAPDPLAVAEARRLAAPPTSPEPPVHGPAGAPRRRDLGAPPSDGDVERVPEPRLRGSPHAGSSHSRSLAYVGVQTLEEVPEPPPLSSSGTVSLTVQINPPGVLQSVSAAMRGDKPHDLVVTVRALADSGAFTTIFSADFIDSLPSSAVVRTRPAAKYMSQAKAANGGGLLASNLICVRFRIDGRVVYIWGHVVETLSNPMLLGMDNLRRLGADIQCGRGRIWLSSLSTHLPLRVCSQPTAGAVAGGVQCAPSRPSVAAGDVFRLVSADPGRVVPEQHETLVACLVLDSHGRPLRRRLTGYVAPTMSKARVGLGLANPFTATHHDDSKLPDSILPGTTVLLNTARVVAASGVTSSDLPDIDGPGRCPPMSDVAAVRAWAARVYVPVANLSLQPQRIRRGAQIASFTVMQRSDVRFSKTSAPRGDVPQRQPAHASRVLSVAAVIRSRRGAAPVPADTSGQGPARPFSGAGGDVPRPGPPPQAPDAWMPRRRSVRVPLPTDVPPQLPADGHSPAVLSAMEEMHRLFTDLRIFETESCKGDPLHQDQLAALVWRYRDIFATSPTTVLANSGVQHSIDTGDARPIKSRRYRRSGRERDIIARAVAKMLADGVIASGKSPWAAQVVLTRKPDGSWRFCTDYSKLAKVTVKDCYPLPRVETIIDATQGATFLSCHDLSSGYWQCAMSSRDGSDLKTAFVTEQGQFYYKVMPFGLTNASATMQRMVDGALAGLLWESVAAYIDDCVVYTSGTFADHLRALEAFYRRIRKSGLHVKPTKCHLARRQVELLGHVVDGTVRSPTAINVAAVLDYARPRRAKALRAFLGLASYFREYVEYFSDVAAPLHALLNSGKHVAKAWDDSHSAAFALIKRALTSAPILHLPCYGPDAGRFEVQTDASGCGIGAVLLQYPSRHCGPGVAPRPVAYKSRGLSKTERGYDTAKRECLGLVYAMASFRHYVDGSDVRLRTDHKNLTWLLGTEHPQPQYAKWKAALAEFRFELRYEGDVAVADALSRDPRWDHVDYLVTHHDFREGVLGAMNPPPSALLARGRQLLQHDAAPAGVASVTLDVSSVCRQPADVPWEDDADAVQQAIRSVRARAASLRDELLQVGGRQMPLRHARAVQDFLSHLDVATTDAAAALANVRALARPGGLRARAPRAAVRNVAEALTRSLAPRGREPLTVIDLFCGGGGFSIGATLAGFDVRLGVDTSPQARATFGRLHPTAFCSRADCGDAAEIRAAVARAFPAGGRPDLLLASPPCTPFSTCNAKAAAQRATAQLLVATARRIVEVSPRAAIIENVPDAGLAPEWRRMRRILLRAGYRLEEAVVDAAKLNVPQRRRRRFLVATRSMNPTHLQPAASRIAKRSDATIAEFFPGESVYWHYGRFPGDCCLRDPEAPSPTLRSNCGYFPRLGTYRSRTSDRGRPLMGTRRFSVEELALVQGWPRSTHGALPASRSAACRVLGNSVCPPVAQFLSNLVHAALRPAPVVRPDPAGAARHVVAPVSRARGGPLAGLDADSPASDRAFSWRDGPTADPTPSAIRAAADTWCAELPTPRLQSGVSLAAAQRADPYSADIIHVLNGELDKVPADRLDKVRRTASFFALDGDILQPPGPPLGSGWPYLAADQRAAGHARSGRGGRSRGTPRRSRRGHQDAGSPPPAVLLAQDEQVGARGGA